LKWRKIDFPKIEFKQLSVLIDVQRNRHWHSIGIVKFGFTNTSAETPVCPTYKAKATHPTVVHFLYEVKMALRR
jgi:hypothetical protein